MPWDQQGCRLRSQSGHWRLGERREQWDASRVRFGPVLCQQKMCMVIAGAYLVYTGSDVALLLRVGSGPVLLGGGEVLEVPVAGVFRVLGRQTSGQVGSR